MDSAKSLREAVTCLKLRKLTFYIRTVLKSGMAYMLIIRHLHHTLEQLEIEDVKKMC